MKNAAMVVLSGGQDSVTCLLDARSKYEEVHAVTFDYGQRHTLELGAARFNAELLGVASHEVINVDGILQSTSPLVDKTAELETYTDHTSMEATIGDRVELTFVPLRNPFFLVAAANRAVAKGCYTLVTGVCQSDNANYPDCTASFIYVCEMMVNEALGFNRSSYTGPRFRIEAPLMWLTKADTVRLAMAHGAIGKLAMAYTHTCYAGQFPPCGKCHSCVLRAEGFRQAGEADPLVERAGYSAVPPLAPLG